MLIQKDTITYDQLFLKQGPATDTMFLFMKEKIYGYCRAYPLDKEVFDMRAFKLDSMQTYHKAVRSLVSKGYLKEGQDSLSYVAALKLFQEHNGLKPDGKVGQYTATALNESTYNKVLRAAFVLDRMRQSQAYPEKHIRINIPEYLLRYYVKDSLKRVHNIIVGKPENQTPELNSKVRNIVVYPYWKVPYSIASKEILPEAKRNVKYLERNNFKVYRHDREINPYAVNWNRIKENSFPYEVIQQPGPDNSLGIIKFEFHNNYSVYVHDTPTKYLFKTDVRSYSHGCMRCQDPVDLAKTVLDYDSIRKKRNDITADSLDSLLTLGENYTIKLKDPIPIFIEYNTVYADREKLIFHLDIYKRDEEYLKIVRE
jgi:murein L,D-transpeptidase YcbB/YkuD